MYHPAAALHQPALRSAIEDDFRKLKQLMAEAQSKPEEKPAEPKPNENAGEQLSLF
jgi:DNA polymerase